VGRRTSYGGIRKKIADRATKHAVDWCAINVGAFHIQSARLKGPGGWVKGYKRMTRKRCRRYVRDHIDIQSIGFVEFLLIPFLLNLVISVVVRLMVDWLFDEPSAVHGLRTAWLLSRPPELPREEVRDE
jgi:hypothetical protein